jgi:hypothetical protein
VPDVPLLWHITVTMGGDPAPLNDTFAALSRLQAERPLLDSLRYDEHRAELTYWEEGDTVVDAASLALRLWNEHRDSAGLPAWSVVGLEVLERDLYQARQAAAGALLAVHTAPRRF